MYLEFDRKAHAWTKQEFSGAPFTPYEKEGKIGEADAYFSKEHSDGRYLFAELKENTLQFWTDPFGFRKGYVKIEQDKIIFTSRATAVLQNTSGFNKEAVSLQLLLGYVPPTTCLYKDWHLIPPGFHLNVNLQNGEVQKKRHWKLEKQPGTFDENAFKNLLEKQSAALCQNEPVSLMLSGGIDSRLIAYSLKKQKKTSHFLKIDRFVPSLEDAATLNNYPESLTGKLNQYTLKLDAINIRDLYIQSTVNALDHSHMGRFKFLYLMQEIAKNNPGALVLNGQTADTLLMKNITGDGRLSKCIRLLFSNASKPIFWSPTFSKCSLLSLALSFRNNKKKWLKQLASGTDPENFFLGYFINPFPFPGIDPTHRQALCKRQGSLSVQLACQSLKEHLINPTWNTYRGDIDRFVPDLLLRSFIYGMDMRGIEDASVACQLKPRFPFMTEEMANFLVTIPTSKNRPTGQYKQFFKNVLKTFYGDSCRPTTHHFDEGFHCLESEMNTTQLGQLFKEFAHEKEFRFFIDHLKELDVFIDKDLLAKIGHPMPPGDFIFLDRLFSLYLWWKHPKI